MGIIRDELNASVISGLTGKRIALMGRLEHVEEIYCILTEQGILPVAILDNDINKHGDVFCSLEIMPPESKDAANIEAVIVYSPRHWQSMRFQLMGLGYEDEKEIVVLNKPSLEKNLALVFNGIDLYESLQLKYGSDVHVFLANCPLGDYYLLGLYLRQFCILNEIDNYVLVGNSKGIPKLSGILDIQKAYLLSEYDSKSLMLLWCFLGTGSIKIKPLTIWQGDFRFNPCMARQIKGMTFMDTFQYMIFNLDKVAKPLFPSIRSDRRYTKCLLERLKLEPGKTVLLVTHSYSLHSLSREFWQLLIDTLNDYGYSVAVNVGGEKEKNLYHGAKTIKEDFTKINDIMEYAGTVIGIRCGFFDITSQAKCKKIMLYYNADSQNVKWNRTDIEFCGLRSMRLDDSAVELLVKMDDKSTIEEIMAAL